MNALPASSSWAISLPRGRLDGSASRSSEPMPYSQAPLLASRRASECPPVSTTASLGTVILIAGIASAMSASGAEAPSSPLTACANIIPPADMARR